VINVESVPVAERLLQTKLFGIPVRRLGQSVALPLAPALLASMLGLQIGVVGPLLVTGLTVGTVLFYRTPQGQSPFAWVQGGVSWLLRSDRSCWQPIRHEATSSVWLEWWRSTGEERTRRSADTASPSEGIWGTRNTTDSLDFEYVRDDGVIVTSTGYARLLEFEATPWLILDESSQESTISAFERYLAGVGSAIQFVTLPVSFDVDTYRSALRSSAANTQGESSILRTGRDRHDEWLGRVVRDGEIRDRRHFLVVSVPVEAHGGGVFLESRSAAIEPTDAIDELEARVDHARTSLPRTGVDVSILSERSAVLEVLYQYYRGATPPADLDHGWLTRRGSREDQS
jgi:hypothetical protein